METFKHYWGSLSAAEKRQLAIDSGSSYHYLMQVARGHKKPGADIIERLCAARTSITVAMLRPELARAMAVQAGG